MQPINTIWKLVKTNKNNKQLEKPVSFSSSLFIITEQRDFCTKFRRFIVAEH